MQPVMNRAARARYEIVESWEAGIVLFGAEVKSVKLDRMDLKGAYVSVEHGELWLKNAHISAYQPFNQPGYDPLRPRKLLLRRKEIMSIGGKVQQKGLTVIPLKVYSKGGLVKVTISLVRGLKKYDKRAKIKKREVERTISRTLKYHKST